jgi:hypothetical protein
MKKKIVFLLVFSMLISLFPVQMVSATPDLHPSSIFIPRGQRRTFNVVEKSYIDSEERYFEIYRTYFYVGDIDPAVTRWGHRNGDNRINASMGYNVINSVDNTYDWQSNVATKSPNPPASLVHLSFSVTNGRWTDARADENGRPSGAYLADNEFLHASFTMYDLPLFDAFGDIAFLNCAGTINMTFRPTSIDRGVIYFWSESEDAFDAISFGNGAGQVAFIGS